MNSKIFKALAIPLSIVGVSLLSSCIDDNYDLSDIDTTAEVKFNDLVLPINIGEINLKEIINLEDESRIKVVDGEYVVVEHGTYESETINIPQIYVTAPKIDPININLSLNNSQVKTKAFPQEIVFPIGDQEQEFTYREGNVSGFIIDVQKVKADFSISIRLSVSGIDVSTGAVSLRNLVLHLPKGLIGTPNMGTYNIETGEVFIGDKTLTTNELLFTMPITEVDLLKANADYEYAKHIFEFSYELGVMSGEVVATDGKLTSIPSSVNFSIAPSMSNMVVTAFTGVVEYAIDGIDLDPIVMTDIPTILSQNVTNLALVNPQIYLSFNNPMAKYQLSAQAGLTITANRVGQPSQSYSLDEEMSTGCDKGDGPYQYCVSPIKPESYYEGYGDSEHLLFSTLGDVLSGNGLPSSLNVTFTNPRIAQHEVVDFHLGDNLGKVVGNYTFLAPLTLKAGSEIVYSSTENGWNDEDIDAKVIKALKIDASVINNIPMDIVINAYPIDVDGNRIGDVEIVGATVNSGVEEQQLSIQLTGEVKHLDGIVFEARAVATDSGEGLKPTQTITMNNIKVTASGSYIKEL